MVKRRVKLYISLFLAVYFAFNLFFAVGAAADSQNPIYANAAAPTEKSKTQTTSVPPVNDDLNAAPSPAEPSDSTAPAQRKASLSDSHPIESTLGNPALAPPAPDNNIETRQLGQRRPLAQRLSEDNRKQKALPGVWQTAGSLLIVLALIIAAAYLFRRFSLQNQKKSIPAGIEILARSNISPRQALCLVKLGGHLLLVGLSPNHMTALHIIDDPEEVAQLTGQMEKQKSDSISGPFGRLFQRESKIYQEQDDISSDDDSPTPRSQPWYQARGELNNLLGKVKGLSKMRFRS